MFDDIRLMNLLSIWRGIQRPKMDITSFGHWSGTGLVDWCPDPFKAGNGVFRMCHHYPNYVPDLLLHGLRRLFAEAAVDYPRKDIPFSATLSILFERLRRLTQLWTMLL
jgi:hypothetical protein